MPVKRRIHPRRQASAPRRPAVRREAAAPDQHESTRRRPRIGLGQITNAVGALAAVSLVFVGLYWNYQADLRQKKAVRVDRTVAMYHNFMSDRQIDELMIFTEVSRAVSAAALQDEFGARARERLEDSELDRWRTISNTANLDIFKKYFPVEQFSAFNTHVWAINNCLFGPGWDIQQTENRIVAEDGSVADKRLAEWAQPDRWGNRDWAYSAETACDTVTVFALYGPPVKEIFYANRGVIYCSALYDNKVKKLSGIELFIIAYDHFETVMSGGTPTVQQPALHPDACGGHDWHEWQETVPKLADSILGRRGIPPELALEADLALSPETPSTGDLTQPAGR